MDMAELGQTANGGVNRQALSDQDVAACRRLMSWGKSLGMQPARDLAGNFFLRLPGSDPSAAPVLAGSHLDSQPTGGKFDGTYGVLAALEACQAIAEAGARARRPIDVVAWMNEEGSRFAPGMMGSAVFAGASQLDAIRPVADAGGTTVGAELDRTAQALSDVALRPLGSDVFAYVEAHIEQGPVLEKLGKTIGVVSGIQGKRTFLVTVQGEAAHAGTSQRSERRDALLSAVAMIDGLSKLTHDAEDIVKFTVGALTVVPNAPSVVASRVTFSIDLRHPDSDTLRRLGDAIGPTCEKLAGPCDVTVKELSTAMSLTFPEAMRDRIRSTAATLGLPSLDLHSAAGHDARYLHYVCPAAMIFIPCHLGITHNEAESITSGDAVAGARVLADVLLELANQT
jgi:N-carbamoyl-L-amino-acid hydrolase